MFHKFTTPSAFIKYPYVHDLSELPQGSIQILKDHKLYQTYLYLSHLQKDCKYQNYKNQTLWNVIKEEYKILLTSKKNLEEVILLDLSNNIINSKFTKNYNVLLIDKITGKTVSL